MALALTHARGGRSGKPDRLRRTALPAGQGRQVTCAHLVPSKRVTEFGFDPQRAFDAVRRLANDAPAQMADGIGRLVRDSSPERLEQVMRSPARKAILEGIFWQMPKQIDPAQAAGVKSSIRWNITGRPDDGTDVYQLQLDDGRCRVIKGAGGPDPRLTITIDGVEFLRLVTRQLGSDEGLLQGPDQDLGRRDVRRQARIPVPDAGGGEQQRGRQRGG